MGYEYRADVIHGTDQSLSEKLNVVAAAGWRLFILTLLTQPYWVAVFEREAPREVAAACKHPHLTLVPDPDPGPSSTYTDKTGAVFTYYKADAAAAPEPDTDVGTYPAPTDAAFTYYQGNSAPSPMVITRSWYSKSPSTS